MRPFLKWAGNKYRSIGRIKPMLPGGRRLIEPFLGAGAVFLNTEYDDYLLADINPDLINLYQILQQEGPEFIAYCRSFFSPANNTERKYYELRGAFNNTSDKRLKAALYVYVNRHSFNGLMRYNNSGALNTPYGKYAKPYFPEEEMLHFWQKSQRATFVCADFEEIMAQAQVGDSIYADPPFVPRSKTSNFTAYSAGGFKMTQQKRLVELAEELSDRGISVLISNHDTDEVREMYQNASRIEGFQVSRSISADVGGRGKADEVLALFCKLENVKVS